MNSVPLGHREKRFFEGNQIAPMTKPDSALDKAAVEAFEDESRQVAATVGPLGPLGSGSMPSASSGGGVGGAVVVSAVGQAAAATTAISASSQQSTSTNVQSFSAESHQQHQRCVLMSGKFSEIKTFQKIKI